MVVTVFLSHTYFFLKWLFTTRPPRKAFKEIKHGYRGVVLD